MSHFTKLSTLLLISLGACLTSGVYAAEPSPIPEQKIVLKQEFCPPVDSLTQNANLVWTAPNGWKSQSPSFLKSLKYFIGAQWVGVTVGQIICSYNRGNRNEFPVNLHRPLVIQAPNAGSWTTDLNGHKNCKANAIHQCPFVTRTTVKSPDIFEDINFYKEHPVQGID